MYIDVFGQVVRIPDVCVCATVAAPRPSPGPGIVMPCHDDAPAAASH